MTTPWYMWDQLLLLPPGDDGQGHAVLPHPSAVAGHGKADPERNPFDVAVTGRFVALGVMVVAAVVVVIALTSRPTPAPARSASLPAASEAPSAPATAPRVATTAPAPPPKAKPVSVPPGPAAKPAGPAVDARGYVGTTARCAAPRDAAVVARTQRALIAVCSGPGGTFEYHAVRLNDRAVLDLTGVSRNGAGYVARNGDAVYTLTPKELLVTREGQVIARDAIVDYRGGT